MGLYNIELKDEKASLDISEWLSVREEMEGVSCPGIFANKIERKVTDLICIKDYVAGMTDRFAESQFKKCVYCWASKEAWNDLEDIPTYLARR